MAALKCECINVHNHNEKTHTIKKNKYELYMMSHTQEVNRRLKQQWKRMGRRTLRDEERKAATATTATTTALDGKMQLEEKHFVVEKEI